MFYEPMFSNPFFSSFAGFNIIEEPLPPSKIFLSKNVDVTEEFRVKYNHWLTERFGREDPIIEKGKCLLFEDTKTIMVPFGAKGLFTQYLKY